MKKVIYGTVIALLLFVLYRICFPVYRITHFYPKSGNRECVVTRVERTPFLGPTKTYFTEGEFEKKEIPSSYIMPYSKGFSGSWSSHLMFRNDTAYYLEDAGASVVKGNFKRLVYVTSSFRYYIETKKNEFLYEEMRDDRSGNVYHFIQYPDRTNE